MLGENLDAVGWRPRGVPWRRQALEEPTRGTCQRAPWTPREGTAWDHAFLSERSLSTFSAEKRRAVLTLLG